MVDPAGPPRRPGAGARAGRPVAHRRAPACRRRCTSPPSLAALPPPHARARGSRPCARRCALRRLDPDDPALDAVTFGDWLAEHGQGEQAIAHLWDLIGRPTLNLPADEASLALAAKVFRTGLLDRADAADIGWPIVPLGELHGDAAARALDGPASRS